MEYHVCPRNHPQEFRAATGSVLCLPCAAQTESNLRALPGLYQESLHNVAPISRRPHQTKVSGSRSRDHLNMSALDTRHNILTVLESWSAFVAEEIGTVPPARTVPDLAHFLLRHLEWLAAQPPAGDFADEIEDLRAELVRTVDPGPGEPRATVRQCVVGGCTGTITTSAQRTGSAGRSSIRCSSGHSWDVHEWITLRSLMERRAQAVRA